MMNGEREGSDRQDAAQTGETTAPEQVHEDGFDLIVGVVSEKDRGRVPGLSHLTEKSVTGVAGGLFDRPTLRLGQFRHIGVTHQTGNTPGLGEGLHKLSFGVGLRPQTVMQVRHHEP